MKKKIFLKRTLILMATVLLLSPSAPVMAIDESHVDILFTGENQGAIRPIHK